MNDTIFKYITIFNKFITENPFLATIIFGIIVNTLYDIIKQSILASPKMIVKISKFASYKYFEWGIRGYELELKRINEYMQNPIVVLKEEKKSLKDNYNLLILTFVFILVVYIFTKNTNHVAAAFGASFRNISSSVVGIVFGRKLLKNLTKVKEYEQNIIYMIEKLTKIKDNIKKKTDNDNP